MKEVVLYTDGSCHGNPGPGGYAAILIFGDKRRELSAGFAETTNNRMELLAAISGLESLKETCDVSLYTDSQYVKNGLEKGWAKKWRSNRWRKGPRLQDPVKNPDLWARLLDEYERHQVTLYWVKGHAGNEENERCDELANEAASGSELAPDEGYGNEIPPDQRDLF